MTIQQEKYLKDCRTRYAADLTDDIMPFWMQHGLDREHGGVYTCVDRDGGRRGRNIVYCIFMHRTLPPM